MPDEVRHINVDGPGPWVRSTNPRLKGFLFVDDASREIMEEIDAISAAGFPEEQRPAGYYRPAVGDRVRFTNSAIGRLGRFARSRADAVELTAMHTITEVGDEVCPGVWSIELSGAWASKLLLCSADVEKR